MRPTQNPSQNRSFEIEIGPARLQIRTPSFELASYLTEFFREYAVVAPDRPIDTRIELQVDEGSGGSAHWENPDPEFSTERSEEGYLVRQRDFDARVSIDGRRCVAVLSPEFRDGVHNLLRWHSSIHLPRHRALLVHGCGIVRDGAGFLFFGPSGAGKTTVTELVREADPGATIIGDDVVLIDLSEDGIPYLCTAALGSGYETAPPPRYRVPLRGLFRLRQHDSIRIDEIARSEQLSAILGSIMVDAVAGDHDSVLQLALGLLATTPVRELRFQKNAGFWQKILNSPEVGS